MNAHSFFIISALIKFAYYAKKKNSCSNCVALKKLLYAALSSPLLLLLTWFILNIMYSWQHCIKLYKVIEASLHTHESRLTGSAPDGIPYMFIFYVCFCTEATMLKHFKYSSLEKVFVYISILRLEKTRKGIKARQCYYLNTKEHKYRLTFTPR